MHVRRIYLVDDDESLLRTLGRLLRIVGFDVIPFASPSRFLQSLDQARPGCVIADLKMPEMNGIELYDFDEARAMHSAGNFRDRSGCDSDSVLAMKHRIRRGLRSSVPSQPLPRPLPRPTALSRS